MTAGSHWPYPGARWWKFDFHTHTPASLDTTAWQNAKGTPDEVTPEKWLLRCTAAEIDCVAITDHNSAAWIDRLKDAYARMESEKPEGFRELHLFPGVEISVNGGFHLLVVFDKRTTTSDIDTLLGKVDYQGTKGDSDGVTRKSAIEVIEAVLEAGGLPIPAHVDQVKGLFQALRDANTFRQVLEFQRVLAAEVVDRSMSKPGLYIQLQVRWTEVLGSDCHTFQGSSVPGSRYTWVKMATPSLEGLRLALLDGEGFSIRRSDDPAGFDPFKRPAHFIEEIEISKARYMGRSNAEELRFSPWFNTLIGGRGTGKSTAVHFLRLGFRRDRELESLEKEEEARRTFEKFNRVPGSRSEKGGLLDETEAVIILMRDGVRHRLRWPQDGQGTVVEEEKDGAWQPSSSQSVMPERFPVHIFSQGQIAALAGESQEALLAVIDEAAEASAAKKAFDEACQRFLTLRTQVRELEGKVANRGEVQVKLEDVRRKLARFEAAHHAEVLKEYQLRARQEREVERQAEAVGEMARQVEKLAGEFVPKDLPPGLFDPQEVEDQEALTSVGRLAKAVPDAAERLREIAAGLTCAAARERQVLQQSAWHISLEKAKSSYEQLVSALKEQGITDPSEYGRLVQSGQLLEDELAQLDSVEKQRQKLLEDVSTQSRCVAEARWAISQRRQQFLQQHLARNPYVRITLLPYGRDSRTIERSFREALGVMDDRFEDDILLMDDDTPAKGVVADLLNHLPDDVPAATAELDYRSRTLRERLEKACKVQGDFGGHFNNFLKREFEKKPEFLNRLLMWYPEDSLRVEYSLRGDGKDFRPIGQASAGQRAAAMLAFLLAHGDEPLVLDQPEDDLDNHLIYNLVVRQLRENKQRRQLIVVTHNPNIVVNGDAEMIHALDFRGGQCRVIQSGSLQEKAVRDEICRVMEGGREAFERRWRRLGQEV